ncbi:MAG: glucose PTS transporter subunit IIA [Oscillospiraceae bacterium]|nr:glucose PTS transporter subunit IIA [Oscillospiraceae bacterium]MDD7279234.1 glucose PTS transporter subunit IIA [Oscillospiraceae bacterium]MDY2863062.1 glucose PTS transporter subunit IIA [Oscillospiraceae bacterium]
MDYKKTAHEILSAIGGKDNLASAAHCATRLRLVIADNSKVKKAVLENIDGVKGVFEASGQLQVIIGTGTVNKVYDEFITEAGVEAATKEDVKAAAAAKSPWYKRAIKSLGDIFVPIIPAIVATGLLNGLLGGLVQVFPNMASSHIYELLNIFSNTALTFLPILIAISAAKIFGGNQYLGAVIGMIMIHPSLINAWTVAGGAETSTLWSWFGLWDIQNVGYQGHVIPVILSVWLMSAVEKRLHKKVPEMLDLFVTPLCSVLIAGFFSLTLIGPVFAQLESWVLNGAQALIAIPFGIGAFIMGGVYAPTVVAGVHHMYNAIEMMMLADNGMNTWMPIATAANVAQGAAALAVALKTNSKKTKAMALPASLSAFLGITEPAIFGVNVRFMRPFIAGMIGGACGAALASIMNVYATANGVTGLFGLLITTDTIGGYILTMLVAFGVAFAVSWIMGIKEDEPASNENAETEEHHDALPEVSDNEILSPLAGKAIALEDVPDPTFAEGILGLGAAVEPSEGKITVPADGTVGTLFDTHHAIGLNLDNGAELLIHIGINTVELNGEGFTAHVSEGDRVKKGQTLITFDKELIASKGYKTVTPVIVTNPDEYSAVKRVADGNVTEKDVLIELAKEL